MPTFEPDGRFPPEVAKRFQDQADRQILNPHRVEMVEGEFDRVNAVQGALVQQIQRRRGIPRGHR